MGSRREKRLEALKQWTVSKSWNFPDNSGMCPWIESIKRKEKNKKQNKKNRKLNLLDTQGFCVRVIIFDPMMVMAAVETFRTLIDKHPNIYVLILTSSNRLPICMRIDFCLVSNIPGFIFTLTLFFLPHTYNEFN